jgi:hypothetical protein
MSVSRGFTQISLFTECEVRFIRMIKCANSQRIKLEKERLVRLKRRKIQQRCWINRFKKLMLRWRKLFFCILMNLTSHSVNREIWVKPRGTDIYNDILNWTPHDWYVNICMSQQTFNHICDQSRPKIQKRTTKLRSPIKYSIYSFDSFMKNNSQHRLSHG